MIDGVNLAIRLRSKSDKVSSELEPVLKYYDERVIFYFNFL